MSTIATVATVASVTGATTTKSLYRYVNPNNTDELIITYGNSNIGIVIDRRAWTMLSINAPVKDFVSIH